MPQFKPPKQSPRPKRLQREIFLEPKLFPAKYKPPFDLVFTPSARKRIPFWRADFSTIKYTCASKQNRIDIINEVHEIMYNRMKICILSYIKALQSMPDHFQTIKLPLLLHDLAYDKKDYDTKQSDNLIIYAKYPQWSLYVLENEKYIKKSNKISPPFTTRMLFFIVLFFFICYCIFIYSFVLFFVFLFIFFSIVFLHNYFFCVVFFCFVFVTTTFFLFFFIGLSCFAYFIVSL